MRRALMVLAFFCGAALTAAAQTGAARNGLGGIDANRDGAITRAEAEAARAELFARLDRDSDGQLDASERTTNQGARVSAYADADGDGGLSRAEFMSQPYRIFEQADADADGALSQSELAAVRR